MTTYSRQEIEATVDDWLAENKRCEATGDWRPLVRFYTDDASYGWNCGQAGDFMANGIDEIRDLAIGQEMDGLIGWSYQYQQVLVDEKAGQVIGLWKQWGGRKDDGTPHEVYGIGGSWFRYGGHGKWSWQRDFMDWGHVEQLFIKLYREDKLTPHMKQRMRDLAGPDPVPGHYPLHQTPVPLW